MLSDMSCCSPRASCVVEASIEKVWHVVRAWDKQHRWMNEADGLRLQAKIVEGDASRVGSVREVTLGQSRMYERLVCLDDETRCLKWKVISHPGSVSPFPVASYVNFSTRLALREVTHGDYTYVSWEGKFYTEREHAVSMNEIFTSWYISGLRQLQDYMKSGRGHSRRPSEQHLQSAEREQQQQMYQEHQRDVQPMGAQNQSYDFAQQLPMHHLSLADQHEQFWAQQQFGHTSEIPTGQTQIGGMQNFYNSHPDLQQGIPPQHYNPQPSFPWSEWQSEETDPFTEQNRRPYSGRQ